MQNLPEIKKFHYNTVNNHSYKEYNMVREKKKELTECTHQNYKFDGS
jgi:hypothetical protein